MDDGLTCGITISFFKLQVDECILWLSIIFITILCTPQPTIVRWSSTPPVSDDIRLQWKGFCAIIANAYYMRGMAWWAALITSVLLVFCLRLIDIKLTWTCYMVGVLPWQSNQSTSKIWVITSFFCWFNPYRGFPIGCLCGMSKTSPQNFPISVT